MQYLIVFSHLRWGFVHQRPQHLLSRLARHYHVLYIEEPVHSVGEPQLSRAVVGPNIDVLTPCTPIDAPGFHDDQVGLLRWLLGNHLREHGIDDYLVWFYTPMALPLAAELQPRLVVYDCMAELSAFKDAPRQMRQREQALLKVADIVFTSGPALYDAKRVLHRNVHCLPSAVEAQHYSPTRLQHDSEHGREARRLHERIDQPRLGYFGVVDERIDLGLLANLADARPDWHIVMVGPVAKIDAGSLPRRDNLHWLGMQPYPRLPYLAAAWDACLMPFALNDATRFISPTKTLEYMAAEKPVVSTAVPDVVALYGDVVCIARDSESFVDACARVMAERGHKRSARMIDMLTTVSRSSWDDSGQGVRQLLERELRKRPAPGPTLLSPAAA